MDSRAILRMDMGFYIHITLGPLLKPCILDPCPFGLTRNVDRSACELSCNLEMSDLTSPQGACGFRCEDEGLASFGQSQNIALLSD